jgi:hypothetical protein
MKNFLLAVVAIFSFAMTTNVMAAAALTNETTTSLVKANTLTLDQATLTAAEVKAAESFMAQPLVGSDSKTMNVLALVFGILSILFFWLPIINLIFILPAVIFGLIGILKKRPGKVMGIIGLILALIPLLLFLL